NFVFGTWAIYIPTVKTQLDIDKSALGLAIFCLALGTFSVLPFASRLIRYFGVGKSTGLGVLCIVSTALFPFLAPSYPQLIIALFLLGAAQGFTDIAMNALVAHIEKEDGESVMTATHGFFSLGGVLAGLGSFGIAWLNNPVIHMFFVLVVVILVNLYFYPAYQSIKAAVVPKSAVSLRHIKPFILLGGISFIVMGSEGAIVDWSALYLQEVALAPEYLVGGGFFLFSLCMTIARFFGDQWSKRFGSIQIIAFGALVAGIGYCLVLSGNTYLALIGFALNGLGFSVVIPEVFRIAGQSNTIDPTKAMSVVAGFGYSGFLLTPVVLGVVSENFGLSVGFLGLFISVLLVLILTYFLRKKNTVRS
ncbi:MAG: MFS transporter, partial [Flavobacteriaceae bacterium]|nr:MFS transporter [Flavobacteriaceae bacterium]